MRRNPYSIAWRRRRFHRSRVEGWPRRLLGLVPLVALAAAGPLVEPVFMGFLSRPGGLPAGLSGLGLRIGMLLCGATVLASYTALVRGPERAILDPHPADAPALLRYLGLRTAVERLGWVLAAGVLLLPIILAGEPVAYGLGVWIALSGWLLGLAVGFPVHLGSVWAAESPGLSGVLNLLRGDNPSLQAALIYGPGVALTVGGCGVWLACLGAERVLGTGLDPAAVAFLLAPLPLALLSWLPVSGLARRYHVATTLILADIDAAVAGTEDPQEARRVYFEWAVRFVPAALRSELLKELRHGWRGLRSWVLGAAWGSGLLAAISAWSDDPTAADRTRLVAGAGIVLVGIVGVRLAMTDPAWLDKALPHVVGRRLGARLLALWFWFQPVVVLPVLALGIRQGRVGLELFGWLELLALAAGLAAVFASPLRARGLPTYLYAALLLWAGVSSA